MKRVSYKYKRVFRAYYYGISKERRFLNTEGLKGWKLISLFIPNNRTAKRVYHFKKTLNLKPFIK